LLIAACRLLQDFLYRFPRILLPLLAELCVTACGKKTYPPSLSPARHMLRCRFVSANAACAGHAMPDQFAKRNRCFPAKRKNRKRRGIGGRMGLNFATASHPAHVGFPKPLLRRGAPAANLPALLGKFASGSTDLLNSSFIFNQLISLRSEKVACPLYC
jgi:hypothetical protein